MNINIATSKLQVDIYLNSTVKSKIDYQVYYNSKNRAISC